MYSLWPTGRKISATVFSFLAKLHPPRALIVLFRAKFSLEPTRNLLKLCWANIALSQTFLWAAKFKFSAFSFTLSTVRPAGWRGYLGFSVDWIRNFLWWIRNLVGLDREFSVNGSRTFCERFWSFMWLDPEFSVIVLWVLWDWIRNFLWLDTEYSVIESRTFCDCIQNILWMDH